VTGGLLAWSAVAASRAEARTLAVGTLRRIYGQDMERIVDACVPHGTADDVVARFAEYADAGAEQILYAPLCDEGGYAAAVEEVGRALGASGGHSGWMTEDPPDSKVRDPEEF
jgi:alkanesulfonate monooxygenase SsuD/methylene tetrahydromethanopterin reductase-like flavin-dependent oxidoreductase (luciferase family)